MIIFPAGAQSEGLPAEESLLYDRYLYLASIGFCVFWRWRRLAAGTRAPAQRRQWLLPQLLAAVLFFGLTYYQNKSRHDELAMTGNAIRLLLIAVPAQLHRSHYASSASGSR
jgi:hypothetical protein